MDKKKQDTVIGHLAEDYPQLYLDPDTESRERYRAVVLRGEAVKDPTLSGYRLSVYDREETVETPFGPVRVVTIRERSDFERVLRNMMAVKNGPGTQIPQTQGAATVEVPDWGRINAHREVFFKEKQKAGILQPDWEEEFIRFTSVRSNYMDCLIILSVGPYSNLTAEEAGYDEDEWITLSGRIRRFHELTHVICRRVYPEQINAVWDELAADAVGIYAAFGKYDICLAKRFLGIKGENYAGGRLGNYTDDPEGICPRVCTALSGIEKIVQEKKGMDIFSMIQVLEANQNALGFENDR